MTTRSYPTLSRRGFLRATGAAVPALSPFMLNLAAIGHASAFSASDYKALVCIFLEGGNDGFNTVLATDSTSWTNYNRARNAGSDPIALRAPGTAPSGSAPLGSPARLGGVLPISPLNNQGRSFAVHPLLPRVRDLFAQRRLAVVSNVGPLMQTMTKAGYRDPAVAKPAKLFSHNDQRATWQALQPEGARVGWGGAMADVMASANTHSMFTSVSAAGAAILLGGGSVVPYSVNDLGPTRIGDGSGTLFTSATAHNALMQITSSARSSHLIERDHAAVLSRSINAERTMSSQLPSVGTEPYGTGGTQPGRNDAKLQFVSPIGNGRVNSALCRQLQVVARIIGARNQLGMKRQVFFVKHPGYDTHNDQNTAHAELMAELNQAITYFDGVMTSLGLQNQVTTFTASDFGRSFTTNGDGTDHGWGNHQLVFGGAVRGGDLYGRFPTYGVSDGVRDFTSSDQLHRGVLLPTSSVEQYAGTLGAWMGLSSTELDTMMPRRGLFATRNLGFMA